MVLAPVPGRCLGEEISWLACVERRSGRSVLQRALFLMDKRGMLVVYLENNQQI